MKIALPPENSLESKRLATLKNDADVLLLFDAGEAEHFCQQLERAPQRLLSMKSLLIEPLERVIFTVSVNQQSELFQAGKLLHDKLETIDRLIHLRPESASEFSTELHLCWVAFIAAGSVARVHHAATKSVAASARAKKPRQKSDIRRQILKAMRASKRERRPFGEFLTMWSTPINGLELEDCEPGVYGVSNEAGDLHRYTLATLEKMYSESLKK